MNKLEKTQMDARILRNRIESIRDQFVPYAEELGLGDSFTAEYAVMMLFEAWLTLKQQPAVIEADLTAPVRLQRDGYSIDNRETADSMRWYIDGEFEIPLHEMLEALANLKETDGLFSWYSIDEHDFKTYLKGLGIVKQRAAGGLYKDDTDGKFSKFAEKMVREYTGGEYYGNWNEWF